MEKKTNKQTSKYALSLLSFQEKIERKKSVGVYLTTVVCHPGAVVSNATKSQL